MKINHNISALMANNNLQKTNSNLSTSLERLSSGYRINKAADDAAGMAISQKMHTQIRGLEQASRNAADGISVIQTAEGALTQVGDMLQRMRELAVQAANDTNTLEDRQAIQKEVEQLKGEINRIADNTEFNTKSILDGSANRKSYSNNVLVGVISLSDEVDTKNYSLTIASEGQKASYTGGAMGLSATATITAAQAGSININGEDVKIEVGQTRQEVYQNLRDLCDTMNLTVQPVDASGATCGVQAAAKFKFESMREGDNQKLDIKVDNAALTTALGITNSTTKGTDATVTLGAGFNSTATYLAKGNDITITDASGFEMRIQASAGSVGTTATINVLDAGYLSLQVGANEGQTVEVNIAEISTVTLGVDLTNMCSQDGAQNAIAEIDDAISQVSAMRAKLGAYQNRLDYATQSLDTTSLNLTEALSRIEDVDMAKEMTTYTSKNVLAQAGTSMLAEANNRPQQILSLLQG